MCHRHYVQIVTLYCCTASPHIWLHLLPIYKNLPAEQSLVSQSQSQSQPPRPSMAMLTSTVTSLLLIFLVNSPVLAGPAAKVFLKAIKKHGDKCKDLHNMSSSPTECSAVQWAMWKGWGLTSSDRLNSSENYLLLGFLLAMPSQTDLLLVRKSAT